MTVYLVESGEYSQRGVVDVFASEQAALDGIKADYPAPYVVTWGPPVRDGKFLTLTGHFKHVQGYSIGHSADFDITAWEVRGEK